MDKIRESTKYNRDSYNENEQGSRPFYNNREGFVEREMFDAICTKCGKPCKVPFKPIPGRPIFCKDCYVRKDKF